MDTRNLFLASLALAALPMVGQDRAHFAVRSDLVVLHVTVMDRHGGYVGGLSEEQFRVFDNGEPQALTYFHEQDAPATVGLVIDSSGSMFANRDRVVAAAAAFAAASHPDDQFFPVTFNDRATSMMPPGMPFTSDPDVLRAAIAKGLEARGRTALFDALSVALDHIASGSHERQALVVISDGGDNASTTTFDAVLTRAQASSAVIYTVALVDPLIRDRNPKLLRRLATAMGGMAFEPREARGVGEALTRIATDIRSSYTLAYVAPDPTGTDERRRLRVEVRAFSGERFDVRARTGYVAASRERSVSETGKS